MKTISKIITISILSLLFTNCDFIEKTQCNNKEVKKKVLSLISDEVLTEYLIKKSMDEKKPEAIALIGLATGFANAFGYNNETIFKKLKEEKDYIKFVEEIEFVDVRTDENNFEIQKCYCSANVIIKSGYAYYAVSYSSQLTEEGGLYVELIECERIEINKGKLTRDIFEISMKKQKLIEKEEIIIEEESIEIEAINDEYNSQEIIEQNSTTNEQNNLYEKKELNEIISKIEDIKNIKRLDFSDVLIAGDNISKNKSQAFGIANMIKQNYSNSSYYFNIVNKLLKLNRGLNKEWSKNQKYFSSEIEFYEIFTSGNYDKILADRKK